MFPNGSVPDEVIASINQPCHQSGPGIGAQALCFVLISLPLSDHTAANIEAKR